MVSGGMKKLGIRPSRLHNSSGRAILARRFALTTGLMLYIYCLTIFVSSSLLFVLQPLFARIVLPVLGGSPSVWNTCMVFFQAALLAGYAYSHGIASRLSWRN